MKPSATTLKRIGQRALRWSWTPRKGRYAPRYRGRGLLVDYLRFRDDPLAILREVARQCGDVGRIRIAYKELYLFNEPSSVRTILVEKSDRFIRRDGSPEALRPFIGRNVLTSSDEEWGRERAAMHVSFDDELEARLADAVASVMRARLGSMARDGVVEVSHLAMQLTFQVSMRAFFDYAARDDEAATFVDSFVETHTGAFRRFIGGIPGSRFYPTPENFRLRQSSQRLWSLAGRVVRHLQRSPGADSPLGRRLRAPEQSRGCLLHALLQQAPRPGHDRATEYVMGFMAAAPENPSNALTWGLHLLASHPPVLHALREESDRVLGVRHVPTLADLPRLTYSKQVIQEILRLYPVAWCFDRETTRDEVVGGFVVPRGALAVISPYLLHRNPRLWEDAERFDPDRFAPGRVLVRGSYIPFGLGPRACIGARFAQLQLRLLLPALVRNWRFAPVVSRPPEPQPMFTLRARSLPMRLTRRAPTPAVPPEGQARAAGHW